MAASTSTETPQELIVGRPDDWHLHLRDCAALKAAGRYMPGIVRRAIIMPNLVPPVVNAADASAYKARITEAFGPDSDFEPLMTLYLTDKTTPEDIKEAAAAGVVACKLYPAGATTNSDNGVTEVKALGPVLAAMAEAGMVLCIHGEVTDSTVDFFERETVFLERVAATLVESHPDLRIVMEHITTAAAVDFVTAAGPNVAATITPQHLLYNRNQLFVGGLKPHYYCLPILKKESDRQALLGAVASGSAKFFMGTDSAPHAVADKESACGCAGCFSAFAALELYATAFEAAGCLDKLSAFVSQHGPAFYRLPRNTGTVKLTRQAWTVPDSFPFADKAGADTVVVPLMAGQQLQWKATLQPDTAADTAATTAD